MKLFLFAILIALTSSVVPMAFADDGGFTPIGSQQQSYIVRSTADLGNCSDQASCNITCRTYANAYVNPDQFHQPQNLGGKIIGYRVTGTSCEVEVLPGGC